MIIMDGVGFDEGHFEDSMREYGNFVDQGVTLPCSGRRERMLLACLGLAGESGEVVDLMKKHLMHGKPEREIRQKLVHELGDVLWYYQLMLDTMGVTWDEVIAGNLDKLRARYPEKHPEFQPLPDIGLSDDQ